jgi:hypothetical protein
MNTNELPIDMAPDADDYQAPTFGQLVTMLHMMRVAADDVALRLNNLVGLARMGAAPLKDYRAALNAADSALQVYQLASESARLAGDLAINDLKASGELRQRDDHAALVDQVKHDAGF